MTENQILILEFLVEMDKFRLERILTLSVFRMRFSQYLEGQTSGFKAKEMVAFRKWDDMKLDERKQVAIKLLEVETSTALEELITKYKKAELYTLKGTVAIVNVIQDLERLR